LFSCLSSVYVDAYASHGVSTHAPSDEVRVRYRFHVNQKQAAGSTDHRTNACNDGKRKGGFDFAIKAV